VGSIILNSRIQIVYHLFEIRIFPVKIPTLFLELELGFSQNHTRLFY